MTMYKLTQEEKEESMDRITDVYDVINEIRGRLDEVYEDVGEICNLVKCTNEIKEE